MLKDEEDRSSTLRLNDLLGLEPIGEIRQMSLSSDWTSKAQSCTDFKPKTKDTRNSPSIGIHPNGFEGYYFLSIKIVSLKPEKESLFDAKSEYLC